MIESRLDLAEKLIHNNSSFIIAIDENEQLRLGLLLESKFSSKIITCVSLIHNPGGIQGSNFSYTHESVFFIYPDNPKAIGLKKRDTSNRVALRDWGGDESKRETAKNCFYPIYIKNNKIVGFGDVCDDSFHPQVNEIDGDLIAVYPIDNEGVERKWRNARGTVESIFEELEVSENNGKFSIYRNKSFYRHKTVWDDSLYNANVYGSKLLGDIVGNKIFSYPKSVYAVKDSIKAATNLFKSPLILDYFAGSGTTAHATIALNREDQGSRKYILVEQGEYFDTVIKPRIQKVVYSADWKEGKPTNPETGVSHCLKVVKLESYEDTLNNLELVRKGTQQSLLNEQKTSDKPADQSAYHDYLMHYMLELESKDSLLNVQDFQKPFSYQMNITTDSAGAYERKNIDLVETFNYLIGMNVQYADYQLDKGYVQITGHLRTGEYTTVLWRDCEIIGYAELNQLLAKLKINPNDGEYQLIYINGDHNVASKYKTKEGEEKQLKVRSIEQAFLTRMFEE